MKTTFKYLFFFIFLVFFSGCFSSSDNTTETFDEEKFEIVDDKNSTNTTQVSEINGKAVLGNLAEAEVEIYEIGENGSIVLKWTDITSSGETLDEIGKFDLHVNDLNEDRYYIFKVKGGKDWDSDDNGIKDPYYFPNYGVIRAIVKGSDVKTAGENLKVTAISELVYEKVEDQLMNNFDSDTFESVLNDRTKEIIKDIDGNGETDMIDTVTFSPVEHKDMLQDLYKVKFDEIIMNIHDGTLPLYNIDNILSNYDTSGIVTNVKLNSEGTLAYVLDGGEGLKIFNISDSLSPTFLGSVNPGGYAYDLILGSDGSYAYGAFGSEGFVILDVMHSSNPLKMSSYKLTSDALDVKVSEDEKKAFVAFGRKGLVILDITDKYNPVEISSYDTDGYARGVALSADETRVYVADDTNGLVIIDVTDISNPVKVASLSVNGNSEDVEISKDGNYLYLANGSGGVDIVDISDVSNPVKTSHFHTGDYIYQLNVLDDASVCISNSVNGFVLADFKEPLNPSLIKAYNLSGNVMSCVVYDKFTKALVAQGENGFSIVDITDKNLSDIIASYQNLEDGVNDMVFTDKESYLYAAAGNAGFVVLDVRDPKNIQEVSSVNTGGNAQGIALSYDGKYAFIADGENGVVVVKILNPDDIRVYSSYDTEGYARDIVLSKDSTVAYVADDDKGLWILNVEDPSNIMLIATLDTDGNSYSLALSSDEKTIFLADDTKGVKVIDVSSLASPKVISSFDTDFSAVGITLSYDGNKTFVSDDTGGVVILDVSDHADPKYVGSYETQGYAKNVTLFGKNAYIAEGNNGVVVVDVSDPVEPVKKGKYATVGSVNKVLLSSSGKTAYIADQSGLNVANLSVFTEIEIHDLGDISSYDFDEVIDFVITEDKKTAVIISYWGDVFIIDISDPGHMSIVNNYNDDIWKTSIKLIDDETFIISAYRRIRIYDMSNVDNIVNISEYNITEDIYFSSLKISKNKNVVYAGAEEGKLYLFGISDPTDIVKISSVDFKEKYSIDDSVNQLELSDDGNYLFASIGKVFAVIDVSVPDYPKVLTTYPFENEIGNFLISADEKKAYVSIYEKGLKVLNIENLSQIESVKTIYETLSNQTMFIMYVSPDGEFMLISDFLQIDSELCIYDIGSDNNFIKKVCNSKHEVKKVIKIPNTNIYLYLAKYMFGAFSLE